MFKAKKFEVLWAVIGFFLCLLPLLIYLIVYATQNDQMVVITVGVSVPELTMSTDRSFWWDGTRWQDATATVPPIARRSDDGRYWWDGTEWRVITEAALSPAPLPSPEQKERGTSPTETESA